MGNYNVTTRPDVSPPELEQRLRDYLPGLDVRLLPIGPRQGLLRGPIVQALQLTYPDTGTRQLLLALGADSAEPISDEASAVLMAGRHVELLPPREMRVVASDVPGVDWHLARVRAPAAWQRFGGPLAIGWGDVRVGHIDTGYTEHPALGFAGASWVDVAMGRTFIPARPEGEGGMAADEPGGGLDNLVGVSAGHGTRMAATISGCAPGAAGGPFFGVAPRVPLIPVRITDVVWINHAQREFGEAMAHLIGPAAAKVVNVSLGVFLGTVRPEMKRALNDAYDAGVIVVCAAGNHVNSVVAPARLSRTLAVAGVTDADAPWGGSSFGPEVDFSAPAADLRRASTTAPGQYRYEGGGDGTSYATAITSGAAALWLAHHGAALDAAYPQAWQRVEAFAQLARQTARVPAVWNPGSFGSGVLDIDALLQAPLPAAATLTQAPRV
jgi:subtilisin family serine protease